jgi:hypothetical protein
MTVNTLPTAAEVISGTQTNAQQKIDFESMLNFLLQQLGAMSGQGPQTVASAATLNLEAVTDTRDIVISGTTAITAVTIEAGKVFRCRASGAFTLTNNASIVTQRGANIVCAAGDSFIIRATAVNTVEILLFTHGAADTFTEKATLASQTMVTAGGLSFPTGLSGEAEIIIARLECTGADGGYSIGDKPLYNPQGDYDGTTVRGLSIIPTASTLEVRVSANLPQFVRKDNGASFGLDLTKWKLFFFVAR